MYAEERQQAIAQLVGQEGRLSVVQLSEKFGVTTETVRRDLSTLERLGLIRRVHGGAVPASSLRVIESGVSERDQVNTAAKEAIALAAVRFLPPAGGTIALDAGSTTMKLVSVLPRDHRLTVVTHAVPLASRLAGLPQVELHLLPGRVRRTTQAAVGSATVAALEDLRVDVAFVATNNLSLGHGLTTPDPDEAATKRALVRAGRRRVLLADSGKVDEDGDCEVRFARLADIDVLVTDAALGQEQRRGIEDAGTEVVVA